MTIYQTDLLSKLLKDVSVELKIDRSKPETKLNLIAGIESNVLVEGWPSGVKYIGSFTVIRSGFRLTGVSIGRFCSVGPMVQMGNPEHVTNWLSTSSTFKNDYSWTQSKRSFPLDNNALVYHDTTIGNDVWIGRGAFIKSGITIGDGAVIGASSVVTKSVPPYSIVAGNPARVVRMRFPEDVVDALVDIKWWLYDPEWISKCDYKNINDCISYLRDNVENLKAFTPPVILFSRDDISIKCGNEISVKYSELLAEKERLRILTEAHLEEKRRAELSESEKSAAIAIQKRKKSALNNGLMPRSACEVGDCRLRWT